MIFIKRKTLYLGISVIITIISMSLCGYSLSTEMAPNRKQTASVIVHDEGALGGSIEVHYERLYGGIVKKSRLIYRDILSEPQIEWIGNSRIKIDQVIIDIDNKGLVDGGKEEF